MSWEQSRDQGEAHNESDSFHLVTEVRERIRRDVIERSFFPGKNLRLDRTQALLVSFDALHLRDFHVSSWKQALEHRAPTDLLIIHGPSNPTSLMRKDHLLVIAVRRYNRPGGYNHCRDTA